MRPFLCSVFFAFVGLFFFDSEASASPFIVDSSCPSCATVDTIATTFTVDGSVLLEDSEDHSGTEIAFYSIISPGEASASTLSDSLGNYSLEVAPGFYLIKWEKYGYLPQELGDFTLNSDTTLNQVLMQPGFVQEVCGEVSGTWSSGFVYHVTCDVVVPEGETLTIEEGVTVRFAEGVGMTCRGNLIAEGTEEDRILFTTLSPTPLPGDWTNVHLTDNDNLIRYVDYEYASDGFTGDFAGNSTFDHVRIASGLMSLDADGIRLSNSSNMTFTNNEIGVAGNYCIYCSNCDFSEFTGNATLGAENGIYAPNSYYLNIEENNVEGFKEHGIYFQDSPYSKVNHNRLIGAETGGSKRAIRNTASNQYAEVNYNLVELLSTESGNDRDQWGIEVHDSEIIGDSILIYINGNCYSDGCGIRANRSTIQDNYIRIEDHSDCKNVSFAIESYGDANSRPTISDNVIEATRESRGIWASYADIENNQIRNWSNNKNDEWAIGHGDYNVIRNNTILEFSSGIYCDDRRTNEIVDNHIQTRHWGVYANNSQGDHVIENNTFDKYTTNGDWLIYVTNAASVTVRGNECEALGGSGFYFNNTDVTVNRNLIVSPGRGIELTNQAGGKVLNNTLVTENGGDYGIKVSNLSAPVIRNNILKGYQTGMQIDNDIMNTNVSHNALWSIGGELFTGSAIAPLIGESLSFNANSDSSDVYGNINLPPMFVAPDSLDYHLMASSPCINAGSPSTGNDPDGTVADIGAYYFDGPVQDTITDPLTVTFTVDGSVLLEDSEDHSGTEIAFYSIISPGEASASTLSDSLGNYSLEVAPGFYLIKWEKYGYLPQELGDFTLNSDTTLNQVLMQPGFVQEVCGEVSGTWSSGFVYHVTCDVVVPEGETLTIEEGVTVRFAEGVGMTCRGNLIAEGTEEDRILFTTLSPTPLPGDWDNVELYGEDNVIRHLDYEFAMDGITGEQASNTVIDHLSMNSLDLNARGVYLSNSFNTSFTSNDISVAGAYGIYCHNCDFSEYLHNTIVGPDNGIHTQLSSNVEVISNEVEVQGSYGIDAYDCDFSRLDSNVVRGYDDGVEYGIRAHDSYYVKINHNDVRDFREYGIFFRNSANGVVNHNRVIGANNGGWMRGIDNDASNQFAQVNYNYVELLNTDGYNTDKIGVIAYDSEIIGDSILVYINGECHSDGRGIRGDRSTIEDNYIRIEDHTDCGGSYSYGIESYGDGAPRHVISNNVVEATRESRGIWASYADIENNQIRNWSNNNNDEWAIGHGDYNVIRNNTVVGFRDGIYCDGRKDNVIEDNHIQTRHWGVYANNSQGDHFIENNTFDKYTTNGDWLIYVTNAASVTVRGNECEALGGSGFYFNNTNVTVERNLIVSPGRGIELTNQAGGKVLNNTLVTENGGDYGIKVSNLSTPVIRNNILKGYQTGMQIDNDIMNTNVSHNALWAIGGELYTGTAIAPLIGEINTTNANGDESDVYGNLNLAPMFLAPDSMDYRLAIESPCINAGDPTMFDPDGTVVDMGAYFSNFVGCTDPEACNYSPNATVDDGSCQEVDECGVCGGDGIPDGDCDCYGNQLDALGVCGGDCTADVDEDGICDDEDECIGNEVDVVGVCGGDCTADEDEDGICDDVDDCVGAYDACGVCNGPGEIYECGCANIPEGDCDCDGNVLDAVGTCAGDCTSDLNDNGICDDEESVGCTYEEANNYDVNATLDDGSCDFTSAPAYCGEGTIWDEATQTCVLEITVYVNGEDDDLGNLNPCYFDSDQNGVVNLIDLLNMLSVYGQYCP